MNRTYKWKIPKIIGDKSDEDHFIFWIESVSSKLCSVFLKGLREKLGFTYDNYNFSRDDFDYAIEFDQKEAYFVVNFRYEREEEETLIFEVFISALKFKKFLFFYRKFEPEREVFDKFHEAVMTIAKENNITANFS